MIFQLYIKVTAHNSFIPWVSPVLGQGFNSLPNNKIFDMTKLKAFADNKLNIAKMTVTLRKRVEINVAKEENAGYKHFLLFQQCFAKPSSLGSLKVGIAW